VQKSSCASPVLIHAVCYMFCLFWGGSYASPPPAHQTHWICGDICVYIYIYIYIYMAMINKTLYRAWDVSGHNYFGVCVFWNFDYLKGSKIRPSAFSHARWRLSGQRNWITLPALKTSILRSIGHHFGTIWGSRVSLGAPLGPRSEKRGPRSEEGTKTQRNWSPFWLGTKIRQVAHI